MRSYATQFQSGARILLMKVTQHATLLQLEELSFEPYMLARGEYMSVMCCNSEVKAG